MKSRRDFADELIDGGETLLDVGRVVLDRRSASIAKVLSCQAIALQLIEDLLVVASKPPIGLQVARSIAHLVVALWLLARQLQLRVDCILGHRVDGDDRTIEKMLRLGLAISRFDPELGNFGSC